MEGEAGLCLVGHLAVPLASNPLNVRSSLPNLWQPECVQLFLVGQASLHLKTTSLASPVLLRAGPHHPCPL